MNMLKFRDEEYRRENPEEYREWIESKKRQIKLQQERKRRQQQTEYRIFFETDAGEIEVFCYGTYVPAERGDRDGFGAQLEPDYDAYMEIESILVEDKEVEVEWLSQITSIPEEEIEEKIEQGLRDNYESDKDEYYERM